MNTQTGLVVIAIGVAIGVAAGAAELEVIFTEVPGHPTAVVPGALDANGDPVFAEFSAMELFTVSADGSRWIMKARNTLASDLDTMLVIGSGTKGTILAQEAQPIIGGAPGEVYDFFGSGPPCFNTLGQFVYTARARGTSSLQKGIFFDGADFHVVRSQNDPALGLLDVPQNPTGDELFGNSVGSMHLLDDGTIGYQDSTIQNIHSSRRPAIFYDDTSFRQSGVSMIGGLLWDSLDSNEFRTTPDGATWIAEGDDEGVTTEDDILVVNDVVVLREASVIPGTAIVVADFFQTTLANSGTWFTRGDDPANDDWAVVNGTLVAATGDPVAGPGPEHWGDALGAFAGNSAGDWVLAGNTDGADPATDSVIVFNGERVVVREGDPVDLDGNGQFDDDAFIGRGDPTLTAFNANDIALTDDRTLYFYAPLRDAAGNDLGAGGLTGDAFLRLSLADCPEDLNGSGAVDFGDILAILSAWGNAGGPEDLDGSGTVDFQDILRVLKAWGPC